VKSTSAAIILATLGLTFAAAPALAFMPDSFPGGFIFPPHPRTQLTEALTGSALIRKLRKSEAKVPQPNSMPDGSAAKPPARTTGEKR